MPGTEIAQYGIGFFAVAGLIYVVARYFDGRKNAEIIEVVQNNTRAIENLTTIIQVNLTRQEAKIDELLERARR